MERVKVGDVVRRTPAFSTDEAGNKTECSGIVVYIHPEGRYHTVAFQTKAGVVKEAFDGDKK